MSLPLRPRPHINTCPGPLVHPDEAFRYPIPQTEAEWALAAATKKIDPNDLAHELGPAGFMRWLDESPTAVLKWPEGGDEWTNGQQLMGFYPDYRAPVIHGLLRETETLNIVSAPKSNKSFLAGNIALNVIGGGKLFGRFQCERGRVAIIDNECHPETLAQRLRELAPALNVPYDRTRLIDYMSLRGQLVDINGLEEKLSKIRYRAYRLIILDALYKFYPTEERFDESDNAAMAKLYTKLDAYADYTGAAFILIHHASKGDQSGKDVTDIGAGAGAQTRACDAHMVLRRHEESSIYVIDCVNRSFPPIQRFCARFKFPVWEAADDKDPEALAGLQKKKSPTVGKKTARSPENATSAPETPGNDQSEISGQAENTVNSSPESQKSTNPAKEVYVSPEDREANRLRDFCGGILHPMTILEIVELGKAFKFKTWTADHLRRTLLPSLIEKGQIALVSEASGRIAAKYQGIPQVATPTPPEATVEAPDPPLDISDDEAYGPDLYAQDDNEPPPWSNDGVE